MVESVEAVIKSEVGTLMADEAETDWHISIHPSALLGADPFDFCSAMHVSRVLDPVEWPTLTERVVRFFEGYEQPVDEKV